MPYAFTRRLAPLVACLALLRLPPRRSFHPRERPPSGECPLTA